MSPRSTSRTDPEALKGATGFKHASPNTNHLQTRLDSLYLSIPCTYASESAIDFMIHLGLTFQLLVAYVGMYLNLRRIYIIIRFILAPLYY